MRYVILVGTFVALCGCGGANGDGAGARGTIRPQDDPTRATRTESPAHDESSHPAESRSGNGRGGDHKPEKR